MSQAQLHRMRIRWLQIVAGAVVLIVLMALMVHIPPALLLVSLGFVVSMAWLWWEGERISYRVWFVAGLMTGASFSMIGFMLLIAR
jgi:hypothetical protein